MAVHTVKNLYNRIQNFSNSKIEILWMYQLVYSLFSIFDTRKLCLYNFCFNALTFVAKY